MIGLTQFSSRNFTKQVLIHTVCWLVYLVYEQAVIIYNQINTGPIPTLLYFYACNIALFYVHLVILQKTISQPLPRYWLAFTLIFTELLFFLLLKLIGDYFLVIPALHPTDEWLFLKQYLGLDLSRNINFAALATVYWSGLQYAQFRRKAAEAQIQNLLAERDKSALEARLAESHNAFLQQQLNPHLLFNTLNFIYSQVFKHSAQGAESVLLLAELMRYSMMGAGADGKVPLQEEIKQLEHLVMINRYRFGNQLQLHTHMTGEFNHHRIIPLALLTLTENIFKHGRIDDATRPAYLSINVDQSGHLTYRSQNVKRRTRKERTSAIGLANLRIRLEYTYGNHYLLQSNEKEDTYEMQLTITL